MTQPSMTEMVVRIHLQAFLEQKGLAAILSDYDDEACFLTEDKTYRGKREIQDFFEHFMAAPAAGNRPLCAAQPARRRRRGLHHLERGPGTAPRHRYLRRPPRKDRFTDLRDARGARFMKTSFTTHVPSRSPVHRVAVFSYGVAAYAIGVAALLGLILAMLGVYRFTGGPLGEQGIATGLTLDLLLLLAFALQHSVMARPAFKALWTRIIPAACERSTYVLATGLILLPMLALWQPQSPGRSRNRSCGGPCMASRRPVGRTCSPPPLLSIISSSLACSRFIRPCADVRSPQRRSRSAGCTASTVTRS